MADRALWIPEALHRFGVRFTEIDGWQTRGRPGGMVDYRGHLRHHTAGGGSSAAPSLNVCIQGRSDVEGPLCQILLGRDRVARIIAAGRCNHAGAGSGCVRYGIPVDRGGWYTTGLEVEHRGTSAESWTDEMIDASRRVDAAMLWGQAKYGGLDVAGLVRMWGHKEYAPDRKIDPYRLDMDIERAAVGVLLRSGGAGVEDELSAEDRRAIIARIDALAEEIKGHIDFRASAVVENVADRTAEVPGAVWAERTTNPMAPEETTKFSDLVEYTADTAAQIRAGQQDAAAADEGKGPGGGG